MIALTKYINIVGIGTWYEILTHLLINNNQ